MPTSVPTREVYWNIQGVWIMYALVIVAAVVFGYGAYRYYQLLMAGKPENRFDNPGARVRALLAHAVAQGRTLRRRYAGLSHVLFSWGFVILFLGTVVVFIHEDIGTFFPIFQIMQGNFYLWFQSLTLDLFGLGAIVGVAMAMLRRAGMAARNDRLYRAPSDPRSLLDDGLILGGFLVILLTGFVIEGARIIATGDPWAAWSPVGYAFGLALSGLGLGEGGLRGLHVGLWWFHLVLALAWLAYLPYSKLRHIVTAPANIYFRSLEPKGALPYLDIEKAFEQDPPPIGIASLADLTWKDRLDVEACTECARCEQACPAARTGKALSPMLLILDLRNQLLKAGGPPPLARVRRARGDGSDARGNVTADGRVDRTLVAPGALPAPSTHGTAAEGEAAASASPAVADDAPAPLQLVGDVITDAVLWDCTTCRACMEACPVFIEHVPKIVEMRRNLVLVESRFEPELQRLFDNLEAAGNPWRFPRSDRAQWASALETPVPILGQDVTADEIDVLYWVGCAGAYDERNQKVARALAGLLQTAGIRFAILGTRENCTGDPARRAGNEYLWQILAGENVATLNEFGFGTVDAPPLPRAGEGTGGRGAPPQKTILASCPHCFNTLKDEYPQLGGMYTVRHHAEYLAELIQTGKLRPAVPLDGDTSVAYHDPCYLGRYQDIYDQPRAVLDAIPGLERKEVRAGCRNNAMCCGAGGAKIWFEERRGTRVSHLRMEQIQAENPDQVAVACPFCMIMLEDGARTKGVYETLPILDISEFLTNSLAAKADALKNAADTSRDA
jgi:Fe-S oxidoreductase